MRRGFRFRFRLTMLPILLILAPVLVRAAPSLYADIDPVLQELFDNDAIPQYRDETNNRHTLPSLDRLDLPFETGQNEDEDARSGQKRSGLRAAMVARGGRGVVVRPGWQVGGDPVSMRVQLEHAGGEVSRRSQPSPNSPYLNVGVLSDVEEYFKDLREQLESMTDQPTVVQSFHQGILREGPRPSSSAAYLHALRSHRPSHRVRSFVEDPGPIELRGANSHDPALLWAGLGRR